MIIGPALTPVLESVAALSAPAYRQEGGASSRLAREQSGLKVSKESIAAGKKSWRQGAWTFQWDHQRGSGSLKA